MQSHKKFECENMLIENLYMKMEIKYIILKHESQFPVAHIQGSVWGQITFLVKIIIFNWVNFYNTIKHINISTLQTISGQKNLYYNNNFLLLL